MCEEEKLLLTAAAYQYYQFWIACLVLLAMVMIVFIPFIIIRIENWLGPLPALFQSCWNHFMARHRVRLRITSMLKRRELAEWNKYKETEIEGTSWEGVPPFLWEWCHPKRAEYAQGYQLAVYAMEEDFDIKFKDEIKDLL